MPKIYLTTRSFGRLYVLRVKTKKSIGTSPSQLMEVSSTVP